MFVFTKRDRLIGVTVKRFFRPEAAIWGGAGEHPKLVDSQERWAVWIMLGALFLGLATGFASVAVGFGIALVGFIFGATLRVDAVFARHAINQRELIELQREIVREIRILSAEIRHAR